MRLLSLLLTLALLLSATSCTRMGIGMPRALIYKDTRTPAFMRAPNKPEEFRQGMISLPESMISVEVPAYKIDAAGWIPPGVDLFAFPLSLGPFSPSVGWGHLDQERLQELSGLQVITFADYREITILGVFERHSYVLYGDPAEELPNRPMDASPERASRTGRYGD